MRSGPRVKGCAWLEVGDDVTALTQAPEDRQVAGWVGEKAGDLGARLVQDRRGERLPEPRGGIVAVKAEIAVICCGCRQRDRDLQVEALGQRIGTEIALVDLAE